jgi:putative transposase
LATRQLGLPRGDNWFLDEVALTTNRRRYRLWRPSTRRGIVLDVLVQWRRPARCRAVPAARVLDGERGAEPRVVITDKLASYVPAIKRVLPNAEHRRHNRQTMGERFRH